MSLNFIKNNWQNLAEAVVRAVATYVGAPYDSVGENYIYVVEKVKNGDVTKSKKSDTVVTVTILLVAAIGIFALIKTSRA